MSGCITNDYAADWDGSGFTKVEIRKAHRRPNGKPPRRCCECGEFLDPGTRYELTHGVSEGSWFHERTCLPCVEIRGLLCHFVATEMLREMVSDYADKIGICHLENLSQKAVQRLTEWARLDGDDEEDD